MNKINWINGQAGGTPLSAENLNQMQDNIEDAIDAVDNKISGTVLYNNTEGGTADSITLAESITNYEKIGIEYCNNRSNDFSYTEISNPNGKNILLMSSTTGATNAWYYVASITVSNNTITWNYNKRINLAEYTEESNYIIKITKVIGYKY